MAALPENHFHTCVTSPPYWHLRSYLPKDHPDKHLEIGNEPTIELYIEHLVEVFRCVRRVLRDDGTVWLNLGDSYTGNSSGAPHSGLKALSDIHSPRRNPRANTRYQDDETIHQRRHPSSDLKLKDLCMIPFRAALALQADGWYLRSVIPWIKRNPMPESVEDRPATATEYFFMLSKTPRPYYDRFALMLPCSLNTHLRVSQATLQMQMGGEKQEAYRSDENQVGKKTRDRTPMEILKHMAGLPGHNDRGLAGEGDGKKYSNAISDLQQKRKRKSDSSAPRSGIKNNSDMDGYMAHPVMARNRRNTDWWMESFQGMLLDSEGDPMALVVNVRGTRMLHFASYPPKVVEPCVLASTSERGCCEKCGAPYERVVVDGPPDMEHRKACGADTNGEYHGENQKPYQLNNVQPASTVKQRILDGMNQKRTVAWIPTCECGAGIVPCRVLDPFGGTLTTSEVSTALGRHSTSIDLNREYIKAAASRVAQPALALT